MKKLLLILLSAATITSCLKGSRYYMTQNLLLRFDEMVSGEKLFGDDDQEYVATSFTDYGLIFFSRQNSSKEYTGGFSIARMRDTAIHRSFNAEFPHCTVYGTPVSKDTISRANVYTVFRDEPDTSMMPKNTILYGYANNGSASYASIHVNNTVEAVAIFSGCTGKQPYGRDDWCELTFIGTKDGKETGTVKFKLFDGSATETKMVTKWTSVDLSALQAADAIDIRISSNRDDYPHYVCLDNLAYTMTIGSKD